MCQSKIYGLQLFIVIVAIKFYPKPEMTTFAPDDNVVVTKQNKTVKPLEPAVSSIHFAFGSRRSTVIISKYSDRARVRRMSSANSDWEGKRCCVFLNFIGAVLISLSMASFSSGPENTLGHLERRLCTCSSMYRNVLLISIIGLHAELQGSKAIIKSAANDTFY